MGVEEQSSFEENILDRFSGCQVYGNHTSRHAVNVLITLQGFDYSVKNWGPQLLARPPLLPRAHFFPYMIAGVDDHQATPRLYSMQGVMQENGHEFVDILKVRIAFM
jgi:hypothetical protein